MPTPAPGDSDRDRLTGSLIAAAVVPSAVFVLLAAGLFVFCCMRRRRIRKMQDNSPYASAAGYSRGGPASTFVSDILGTFSDETKRGWSRGRAVELEMETAEPPVSSYLSVLSSNLSGSFRSLSRHHPQDSTASGLASPLSAPPPARVSRRSKHLSISAAAADGTDQALLPSPRSMPKSPESPRFPGMAMISEEGGANSEEGCANSEEGGANSESGRKARQRSSLEVFIYECMEMDERRIGQAI